MNPWKAYESNLNSMKTFRYNDRKYHLVLSFEDNGRMYYVVKYFGRYKQWWHYEVISWDELQYRTRQR